MWVRGLQPETLRILLDLWCERYQRDGNNGRDRICCCISGFSLCSGEDVDGVLRNTRGSSVWFDNESEVADVAVSGHASKRKNRKSGVEKRGCQTTGKVGRFLYLHNSLAYSGV